MRSAVQRLDAQCQESVSHQSGHGARRQRSMWRQYSQKDLWMSRLGAYGIDVARDRLSHGLREWIYLRLPPFQPKYPEYAPGPIDLVEAQRSDLAAAHSVNGEEHQDRAIADVRRRIASSMRQNSLYVRPSRT